jgi:hypothetical protein
MARRTRRKSTGRKRKSNGGGFSFDPSKFVSVGNLENLAYTGAGKDCPSGSFVRPGFMSGMKGGYQLEVAPLDVPAYTSGTVGAPGVPHHAQNPASAGQAAVSAQQGAAQPQKGGRYESNPGALINGSAIGMNSYAAVHQIGCERGTTNSLNMRGGSADSMRVYAPTAGYGHGFETYPGTNAVGGLMMNMPYDARAYNPACSKTGGGHVAANAAPLSALQVDQMVGRGAFDGSKGLLPMKYGGKRRTHKRKHSRKNRKHSRK